MMNIVVLDGYTLNPGDLNWEPLLDLSPDCKLYERTAPQEVIDRAQDAEIVLTNKVVLDRAMLAQLPAVKYTGVHAGSVMADAIRQFQQQRERQLHDRSGAVGRYVGHDDPPFARGVQVDHIHAGANGGSS